MKCIRCYPEDKDTLLSSLRGVFYFCKSHAGEMRKDRMTWKERYLLHRNNTQNTYKHYTNLSDYKGKCDSE